MLSTEHLYKLGEPVDWTSIESTHSRNGQLPHPGSVNADLYLALMRDCDARKAEALVLDGAADPLLTLRSLLFRGRLTESRHLIDTLKNGKEGEKLSKLLTEEARLAAFDGDWEACAKLCEEAYATVPPAITRLAILQIGALARFELGDFAKARFNLSLIESMKSAFPKCISIFYAELLQLRILARGGVDRAPLVRAQLRALWKKWVSEPGDIDQLQTLLRVEVDLRRIWKVPHFSFSLGAYLVAHAMGEDLYSALALTECFAAAPLSQRQELRTRALELAFQFARVRKVFGELDGLLPPSTSVQAMRERMADPAAEPEVAFDESRLRATALVIPEYGVIANLAPFRVLSIEGYPQFIRIFQTLAKGPVAKGDFFKEVWGNQKYAAHLHDGLIYTALYRLKKECGVPALIRSGEVCLEDAQVIA